MIGIASRDARMVQSGHVQGTGPPTLDFRDGSPAAHESQSPSVSKRNWRK